MADFDKARQLLRAFKGDRYIHGIGVIDQVGQATAGLGKRAALVLDSFPGSEPFVAQLQKGLQEAGVDLVGTVAGAAPNAPLDDLARIHGELAGLQADVLVGFGGGSTLDAVKAADALRVLGGEIEDYFGTGLVTEALAASGKSLTPFVAIQTAASSGAHLTKYSNITDVRTGQKKLIVDEAVVPAQPVFDYAATFGAPPALTADGALDGMQTFDGELLKLIIGGVVDTEVALANASNRTNLQLQLDAEGATEEPASSDMDDMIER